jgi:hypothetical protein
MTVRGQAVILKLNFQNRVITKKGFLLGRSVRISNVHPVHCTFYGCTKFTVYTGNSFFITDINGTLFECEFVANLAVKRVIWSTKK